MKIDKITPINPIPKHHLKWVGHYEEKAEEVKEQKKAKHHLTAKGELTLYNRYGRIIKYNTEEL